MTMAPAWDSPARPASPNRSGWAAIGSLLRGRLSRHLCGKRRAWSRPRSKRSGSCFRSSFDWMQWRQEEPMDTMMAEEARLPADIDAQPLVQAAAALQPVLRDYHEEIEREQRLPPALGRAIARRRLLPDGDPARAGRPRGRPADLSARRRAAGRGRRFGRLEHRQQRRRPARHARPAGRGRRAKSTRSGPTRSSPAPRCRAADRRCRSRAVTASAGAGSSAAAVRRPPGCWAASR